MGKYIKKVLCVLVMKHTLPVTFTILGIFFITQLLGLVIINNYIDHQALQETGKLSFSSLPLGLERPVMGVQETIISIVSALLIGTLLALLLIRFKQVLLWKIWFVLAVFITLNIAFRAFIPAVFATTLAVVFAAWKIFWPNLYVQNFTELFVYGGLAAIFVPLDALNIFSMSVLLVLISIYDAYAVWKSKHMIKLAQFQTKSKMFAGLIIPYEMPKTVPKNVHHKIVKVKTAVLGGGDVGFPLLFTGVVFKGLLLTNSVSAAFGKILVVPVITTIALGWLLFKAKQDRFYPAMPFISAGCFVALLIMKLVGFI